MADRPAAPSGCPVCQPINGWGHTKDCIAVAIADRLEAVGNEIAADAAVTNEQAVRWLGEFGWIKRRLLDLGATPWRTP